MFITTLWEPKQLSCLDSLKGIWLMFAIPDLGAAFPKKGTIDLPFPGAYFIFSEEKPSLKKLKKGQLIDLSGIDATWVIKGIYPKIKKFQKFMISEEFASTKLPFPSTVVVDEGVEFSALDFLWNLKMRTSWQKLSWDTLFPKKQRASLHKQGALGLPGVKAGI